MDMAGPSPKVFDERGRIFGSQGVSAAAGPDGRGSTFRVKVRLRSLRARNFPLTMVSFP
jgi:hypothetical protein